ncbi:MAG TPA: dockerin type I domain-containing protein, partial [Pirellulales bacterium]
LQSDAQTPYPGVAPSLPFFVLFDNNENLATYTAAQNWVQTNLVPFGDFNRDGITTPADVSAMISALNNLSAYKTNNQLTDFDLQAFGDINQDGLIDNRDVQALLTYLADGGTGDTGLGSESVSAVPEPSSRILLLFIVPLLPAAKRLSGKGVMVAACP